MAFFFASNLVRQPLPGADLPLHPGDQHTSVAAKVPTLQLQELQIQGTEVGREEHLVRLLQAAIDLIKCLFNNKTGPRRSLNIETSDGKKSWTKNQATVVLTALCRCRI